MREILAAAPKWILAGVAILALCLLVLFARKRGTRAYRWRVAVWGFVIGLVGGTATTSCIDPVDPPDDDPPSGCYGFAPKDYDRSLVDPEGHLRVDRLKSPHGREEYGAASGPEESEPVFDYGAPDAGPEGEDAGNPSSPRQ